MKKITYTIICILFISCGSTKLLAPDQSDADRASNKFPGVSVASLTEGKTNFETQCSTCHRLKNPVSRTESQWRSIVPRMAAKASKKAGKEVIDVKTQESILQYLITMSGK